MRAMWSGTGIVVNLGKEDKETILKGGHLESKLEDEKLEVSLYVKSKVKNGTFEEPGFHIIDKRAGKYKIYMERKIFDELTRPIPEYELDNYWASRSMHDRIEFIYWYPQAGLG